MDGYISKPVKQEDFAAALHRWASGKAIRQKNDPQQQAAEHENAIAVRIAEPALFPDSPASPGISAALDAESIARLRALAEASEPSLLDQIFTAFLQDSAERIRTLRDALSGSDPELIRRAAHALRGASANVGALQMADVARRLEGIGDKNGENSAAELIDELEGEFGRVMGEISEYRSHNDVSHGGNSPL
jgi:HPt (histidine-containing phosphotransfer) domain-containing protein